MGIGAVHDVPNKFSGKFLSPDHHIYIQKNGVLYNLSGQKIN